MKPDCLGSDSTSTSRRGSEWAHLFTLWAGLGFLLCNMEIKIAPCFTELSCSLHEIMCVACLAQCLARSKCSTNAAAMIIKLQS